MTTINTKNIEHNSPQKPIEYHVRKWLSQTIPIFSTENRFTDHMKNDSLYALLSGYIQSGKTQAQIGVAFYDLKVKNRSSVWILRNLNVDLLQAQSTLSNWIGDQSFRHSGGWGYYSASHECAKDIEVRTMTKLKTSELSGILSSRTPSILIVLANTSQLDKICTAVAKLEKERKNISFNLVIDEVDEITDDKESGRNKRMRNMSVLRDRASSIVGVTATSFNVLFGESKLTKHNVFTLPRHLNYVGVQNFGWKIIDEDDDLHITPADSVFKHPSLKVFLDDLTKDHPYGIHTTLKATGEKWYHPVIALVNTSKNIIHFDEFVNDFQRINDKDWLSISIQGKGISMYHHSFIGQTISIPVRSRDPKNNLVKGCPLPSRSGLIYFKHVEIGDVLEYVRLSNDKNMMPVFTHVAIIVGKLGERGISFSSNNYNIEKRLHITDMFYVPSRITDCGNMIQAMRPAGIFNDTIKPMITTTQWAKDAILKADKLQSTVVDYCQPLVDEKEEQRKEDEEYKRREEEKEGYVERPKGPKAYLKDDEEMEVVRDLIEKMTFSKKDIPDKKLSHNVKCEKRIKVTKEKVPAGARDGEYYRIIPEGLTNQQKEAYDIISKHLNDRRCVWILRTNLQELINEVHGSRQSVWGALTYMCQEKSEIVVDESSQGLLFKQDGLGSRWSLRLN